MEHVSSVVSGFSVGNSEEWSTDIFVEIEKQLRNLAILSGGFYFEVTPHCEIYK